MANAVKGWVFIGFTVIPAAVSFAIGIFQSVPLSMLVPLVTGTLAAGAVLAFYLLRGYELVSGWYGAKKEALRVAGELEELTDAGHSTLRIGEIAQMWADEKNGRRFNVRLRKLKQAAGLGMIKTTPDNGAVFSLTALADLKDSARFFREQRWKALPPIAPPPAAERPVEPARHGINPFTRRSRSNWILGWRDWPH